MSALKLSSFFALTFALIATPAVNASDSSNKHSKVQVKIVGGVAVPINYAPWQVALLDLSRPGRGDWSKQFCGGSIISQYWILTAAHCLEGYISVRNLRILAGQATLSTRRVSTNLVSVSKIEIHEFYNPLTFENDIALIKLISPLVLNLGSVEVINIPINKPISESIGRISGWGYTWPNDGIGPGIPIPGQAQYPENLMGGEIPILDDVICSNDLGSDFISLLMLCAGGEENNQGLAVDTCYGDSGGPLAVKLSSNWFIAGITSWGFGCGWTTPGVYTNVSNYKVWIDEKVNTLTPQTITFSPPATLTLAQSPFTLTASSSSGLTPIIISTTLSTCTVFENIVTLLTIGSCQLTARQNGNATFAPANPVTRTISIINSLTPQTITFSPPATLTLAQSPFTLTASSSSGLTPTIISRTKRVCTVSGNLLYLIGPGTCQVRVEQNGNSVFAAAPSITRRISIS